MLWHWLLHVLGVDDVSGRWYAFFSGAGSDVTELAIIGGLVSIYRKHNCPVRHCWRLSRHKVPGTDFTTCRRHHPHDDPTHEDILSAHQAAQRGRRTPKPNASSERMARPEERP